MQQNNRQPQSPPQTQKPRKKSNDSDPNITQQQAPNSSRTFGRSPNKIIIHYEHYEKNHQNNGGLKNINVNINMKMGLDVNYKYVYCVLAVVLVAVLLAVVAYGELNSIDGNNNKIKQQQILGSTSSQQNSIQTQPTQPIQSKYLKTQYFKIPKFHPILCIIFSFNSEQYIKHTLQSLLKHNKYPLLYTIVVMKSMPSKDIAQKYPHIVWMTAQSYKNSNKMYQSLDTILTQYKQCQYIFITDDQWIFVQDKFIQDSIKILQKYQDISQLLLIDHKMMEQHRKRQKLGEFVGFSWTPGLHRRRDIWDYQGKFQDIGKEGEKNMVSMEKIMSREFVNSHRYALGNGKIYAKGMYSSDRFTIINQYDQKIRAQQINKEYPGK